MIHKNASQRQEVALSDEMLVGQFVFCVSLLSPVQWGIHALPTLPTSHDASKVAMIPTCESVVHYGKKIASILGGMR